MTAFGRKLVRSAGWAIAGDACVLLSGTAAALIAARIVPRAEIGLVATVALLVSLLETLTASGVEQALVQRAETDASWLEAGFSWQLARGLGLSLLLLAAAPLLAALYAEPRLLALASALALQPLLRGANQLGVLTHARELEFRALFALNALPAWLRLCAVLVLGLAWGDAWALVAAALLEHAARLVLSFALAPARVRPRFDRRRIAALLRFGRFVTAASIVTFLNTRGDDLFVSKRFGASELASYQLAYALANAPASGVAQVLGRVSFPAYARLHGDRARLQAAFAAIFPGGTQLALVISVALFFAFPFLPCVVGEPWRDAVAIGQLLVLGGALRALLGSAGPLFLGTGRPELDLRMNLPRLLVLALLLGPLSALWGLHGVALASVASVCACLPFWWLGVRAQTGLPARELARSCARALLPGALAVVVFAPLAALMPRSLPGLIALLLAGGALSYAGARAFERIAGRPLLPSLERMRAL